MVFSSMPAYLDPSNWQQQQNHQIIGSTSTNPFIPTPPPPPPQPNGSGSIRPGSMSDKARMANIPMPETALKCPRCESTNTKFCYFNNYSLSQPRHFCKTCRRYWTRGGALRTVPVGGGCRRNKRSKSTNSSKSPASSVDRVQTTSSSAMNLISNSPQQFNHHHHQPLRFMSPLSQLTDNFTSGMSLNYSTAISSNVIPSDHQMNFNLLGGGGGVASFLSGGGGGIDQPWRMQPFPFMDGVDQSQMGLYQFNGGFEGGEEGSHQNASKISSSMLTQMESVKMEENARELNLSRQFNLGGKMPENNINNNNQWNNSTAANWGDLSSFRSSSTSNPQ